MGGNETMTEKRFEFGDSVNLVIDNIENKSYGTYNIGHLIDILNEQDQQIKELEKTIKKLVIELVKPPCVNNNDNYETLRKFLKEEYDITCTQIDIDVENEKMVFKIEEEMKQ